MDHAVIVAGGKGLRMGSEIPKQFIPLCGEPILMRTIRRFRDYSTELDIILVLPKEQQTYWEELCRTYSFEGSFRVADGGETRFHSVRNALELIEDENGLTAVHDGVRPFPSLEVIGRCYETARSYGTAVPVVPVVETLRRIVKPPEDEETDYSETVKRDDFRLVQTPQVFGTSLLKRAYRQPFMERFTDDASVVEHMGERIMLVEGNRENIKITTPFDLKIAAALLK